MNAVTPLRIEVSYFPTFDYEGKVAWAMQMNDAKTKGYDAAIQANISQTQAMIATGEYAVTPAHSQTENEVGFELLSPTATPEEVATQAAEMQKARDAGKTPFTYECVFLRTVEVASTPNPNRVRPIRGRLGTAAPNLNQGIAG